MRTRIFLIGLVVPLVLAACGGGGSKSSSTTSAPSTSAASGTTSGAKDASAEARARKLVLVQADFPQGWTGTPASADTAEDKAANQEFSTCIGSSGESTQIADVKGDDFTMGSPATQAGSEAQIVKEEAAYRKDVAALKGPKFQPCFQDLLAKALTRAAGGTPANVQVSPLSVPTFGDVSVGLRMSATITVQGQSLSLVIDAVAIGKDKAEVTGTFSNLAQPFDQALEKTLIGKLGAKLNAS